MTLAMILSDLVGNFRYYKRFLCLYLKVLKHVIWCWARPVSES